MRISDIAKTKLNQPFHVEGEKNKLFKIRMHSSIPRREVICEANEPLSGDDSAWVLSSAETVQKIIALSPQGIHPIYAFLPKQLSFFHAALEMGFYYMARDPDGAIVLFSGIPKRNSISSNWALGIEGNTARFIFDAPVSEIVLPCDAYPLDIQKSLRECVQYSPAKE